MRNVGQKESSEEKSKRMSRNFALFFLGMMVLSSIGYAFLSNPNTGSATNSQINSGVYQLGDRWVFGQAGREISLAHSPQEVENVSVFIFSDLTSFVQEPLFLDIENPGILNEIVSPLQIYPSRIQEACYGSCERDLPEKNCTENLIVFRENQTMSVRQFDKCIFVEGDMRAADALIYNLFGISNS